MYYKNIHTGEIVQLTVKDVVTIHPTTRKRTKEKDVLFLENVESKSNKSKTPFRVAQNWNRFETFIEIQYESNT